VNGNLHKEDDMLAVDEPTSEQTGAAPRLLFTPVTVGALRLPNRVVMAPMTRNRAGPGNVPTPLMATYYQQRASAGFIVTEATQVSPEGVGYPNTPGIHSDEQVRGWRRVTRAVHAAGGRILLQLWHVGRISHPSMQPGGAHPVAPSAIKPAGTIFTPQGVKPFVTPRALETHEIPRVIAQFADGARRAKEAGFDGVEIHGANGYLIDQFLRDGTNRRTDRYGGTVVNRVRFLREVAEAVVGVWGEGRVGVRISPTNPFNDMRDSNPVQAFSAAARSIDSLGLAYLHVVEPAPGSRAFDPTAPRTLAGIRAAFHGPIMVNGGYSADTAEGVIAQGEADLVSFAVLFLANPDLPERFAEGSPLNEPDPSTFYGGDERGYTDYPTRDAVPAGRE
jgi:N-ethylmaleimide reductase